MFKVVKTLDIAAQNILLDECRHIARQAPLFQKTMPNGAEFNYLCTSAGRYGWLSDRQGYRYEDKHPVTRRAFPEIPEFLNYIVDQEVKLAGLNFRAESALVNWYRPDSSLGLHVDNTEECAAPVISISLGDSCEFIIGGKNRSDAKRTITLHSGDILIMSGDDRFCYHGVKRILAGTAPTGLGIKQHGRINITVRQVKA